MQSNEPDNEILYYSFNQDQTCFSVGTQTGFKIYSTNPFKETHSRNLGGGIGIVEMLYKCNILALVGGGNSPKYPLNKVMLWDDNQQKCIAELSFRNDIKAVKLKSDKIIVVTELKIYVYDFIDIKLLDHIETIKNPKGLFSLNTDPETTVLACMGKEQGLVSIHCYDTKQKITLKAHQSQIGQLELDHSGKFLATCSEKGTIIRIFNTKNGDTLRELRRGTDYATITSIAFNLKAKWLAVSSDTGTVHIFSLHDMNTETTEEDQTNCPVRGNVKSRFSFLNILSSYFDSEWSFAQFRSNERKSKLAFSHEKDSLYIVGSSGVFYEVNYDSSNGGPCTKRFEEKFVIGKSSG